MYCTKTNSENKPLYNFAFFLQKKLCNYTITFSVKKWFNEKSELFTSILFCPSQKRGRTTIPPPPLKINDLTDIEEDQNRNLTSYKLLIYQKFYFLSWL